MAMRRMLRSMDQKRLLQYLLYRRSSLRTELAWLRDRRSRGIDPQPEDEAIVLALARELAEVSALANDLAGSTGRLH